MSVVNTTYFSQNLVGIEIDDILVIIAKIFLVKQYRLQWLNLLKAKLRIKIRKFIGTRVDGFPPT